MTHTALAQPHLAGLLADLDATRAATERLAELADAQLTWRPEPDVWSIADCFEHLRKIDKAYCRKLAEAIPKARPGAAPYQPSWLARKFIGAISPASTFKLKAPKGIRPKATPPSAGADALQRFLDQQAEVADLIRAADGKNVNTGRFASPLAAVLRFSVGEGLTVLVRHEQRHLGQAQRLIQRADFPRA